MTVWNVETFIERFMRGTLGRKSQYSTYHVVKFDSCHILVNKYNGRGVSEERPVAIYFGPELTLVNASAWPSDLILEPAFITPFLDDCGDITESGLIDIERSVGNPDVKSILIQFGHRQYLIEPYYAFNRICTYSEYQDNPYDPTFDLMKMKPYGDASKYGFWRAIKGGKSIAGAALKPLPEGFKFDSIKDARVGLVPQAAHDNPDRSFQYMNFWFAPVDDYEPETLSPEDIKTLENPPMPWHYNLTSMTVSPAEHPPNPIEGAVMRGAIRQRMPGLTENIDNYIKAKAKYAETIKKLDSLYINQAGRQADFHSFYILPASSDMDVRDEVKELQNGNYYVRGGIYKKIGVFGYGVENIINNSSVIKDLNSWYLMAKEF